MSAGAIRAWAAARSPIEWLALAAGVACFVGIGWDAALWEPQLQLVLHLLAVGAIVGVGLAAWTGRLELPVTRVDLPLLVLVATFALATASAQNVGMSLRSFASIAAFALMVPVALAAIRHRPSWVGAVTGGSVLLLSIPTLVVLLVRRAEWVLAGGPGLPPLRLGGEGTPFGSVAVPPFVIWPAWVLAGLIEAPVWRRAVRIGLVVVGVPLTILSGSRSAWLAIGATALVAGIPWLWQRRAGLRLPERVTPRQLILVVVGIVAVAVVVAVAVPRVLAVTSLLYRVALWRDTLTAWSSDPLLGIGPGFMPIARQAAAADFSDPVRQPHSHNLPLGVLGDAGLLGLTAGLALVAALLWVAGPWRSRTRLGRQAAVVLVGLGIAGLFEDITFEPGFNLLAIGLVAVALTDAGAVRWTRLPSSGWPRIATAGLSAVVAAVLGAAMVVSDAGAIAYRTGVDHAVEGRWDEAATWLERAVAIDPWHPAGPKSLAVVLAGSGDLEGARGAAEAATRLNDGDASSWTNLALVCHQLGDEGCALHAARRATATSAFGEPDPYLAALLLDELGLPEEADDAYRRSLLSHLPATFGDPWPRRVTIGKGQAGDAQGDLADLNRLLAWWALGEPIDPEALASPALRALAHAMLGERDAAEAWVARAIGARPDDARTWEIATVLRAAWGDAEGAAEAERLAEIVRGAPLPDRYEEAALPNRTRDLAVFRQYPGDELVPSAARLRVRPPFPWALETTLP